MVVTIACLGIFLYCIYYGSDKQGIPIRSFAVPYEVAVQCRRHLLSLRCPRCPFKYQSSYYEIHNPTSSSLLMVEEIQILN